MTREAVLEYARAVSRRYLAASKREKGVILDEFCKTSGHHRKSAVRLFGNPPKATRSRLGRPRQYGSAVVAALREVWQVSDCLCSKRLQPFIGELVSVLERQGELSLTPQVREQLLAMSASTMDRSLERYRSSALRRPYTSQKSPRALRSQIPIGTFGEWEGVKPGSMQLDLVAHCGTSTAGFHLCSLVAVDVATGWSEFEAVWGKGQQRVGTGVHKLRTRLPFRLQEIHTDNGGEFINDILYPWCRRESIRFTRGRPYKKNDRAYVEQKNWSVPRRLIGYDRYDTKVAYHLLQRLYGDVRLYVNFFQPLRKLVSKERLGAKVKKRYDQAQTPYQRLLAAGVLQDSQRQDLASTYASLNPAQLRRNIDETLEALWRLTQRPRTNTTTSDPELALAACG